ncbi:MAG TPA: glycoside hydrolase family 15 protein [Polyangiaceae bacterium]|nr:glycoside hydrolase family 15 protein [Polyangiaceae bacterium]
MTTLAGLPGVVALSLIEAAVRIGGRRDDGRAGDGPQRVSLAPVQPGGMCTARCARMASLIENYGFISNLHGSALVSREGSIDWLCVPRFDSEACMAALLGRDEHGCWTLYPQGEVRAIRRRYRPGTLIIETDFECAGGRVRLTDFMPFFGGKSSVVRILEGLQGTATVDMRLSARFGYGGYAPWVSRSADGIRMTVAPDTLVVRTPAALQFDDKDVSGVLSVAEGQIIPFELTWHPSDEAAPPPLDVQVQLVETELLSRQWCAQSTYTGPYADAVNDSLRFLKGMIYQPSGGIVAAPTAGLPEELGGVRNWDYRYCWLRDATLTLRALMIGGYAREASAWRNWLINAIAGAPEDLQIMYGIRGERRLTEFDVPWLPGYEESRPVRIGNAASGQFQLDVYGETIHAIYEARCMGLPEAKGVEGPIARLVRFVEEAWQRPDDGIWEVRGGRRHFVHSKLMAWVAFDRLTRLLEEFGRPDDPQRKNVPHYRAIRDRIHRDICEHGFDRQQNAFTQAYNRSALDAAALLIPAVGFLPASDPRVQGTIRAIEKNLVQDGFVLRYRPEATGDGLPGSEGAFLACTFWLVDAYAYSGRRQEAEALFERLLSLRNDLGLLSEEYDPKSGRLIGNFPQAFSHLALIHSAHVLAGEDARTREGVNGHRPQAAAAPPAA